MSLIAELSRLSEQTSSERRRDVLRSLTDLFMANSNYIAPQLTLFDEIFATVAESVAIEARAEMAERLADRPDAPPGIVERLARDEASVATPILERSTALSDGKLADIARSSSQAHLLAISGRPTISEIITDVLVKRGDNRVVRRVAGNQGASFSLGGFSELARKAEGDQELQIRLVSRQDLPAETVEYLLPHLSQTLMIRLADAGYDHDGRLPPVILEKVRKKLSEVVEERDRLSRRLEGLVRAVRNGRYPLADLVQEVARDGAVHDLATVLSAFCDLDVGTVHSALVTPSDEPTVLIGRALDLHWACFSAIIDLRKRLLNVAYVEDPTLKAHYSELSPRAAQRSLRFIKISATVAAA